jgi:hypothetical protein
VRLARETQLLRFLRVGDRPSAIRQRGNEVVEAMGADAMARLPALGRLVGCDPNAVDAVFTAPSAPDHHCSTGAASSSTRTSSHRYLRPARGGSFSVRSN